MLPTGFREFAPGWLLEPLRQVLLGPFWVHKRYLLIYRILSHSEGHGGCQFAAQHSLSNRLPVVPSAVEFRAPVVAEEVLQFFRQDAGVIEKNKSFVQPQIKDVLWSQQCGASFEGVQVLFKIDSSFFFELAWPTNYLLQGRFEKLWIRCQSCQVSIKRYRFCLWTWNCQGTKQEEINCRLHEIQI